MMEQSEIDELTRQARRALREGNDVRAVAIADQLLGAVPDDPQFHAIRAQGLLSSQNVEDALTEARRAVQLNEHDQYARWVLGLAAWRNEKLTLAQESLERAVELSDADPQLMTEYAWFMANERGPRPAEQAAERAVEADETSSTAWAALGLARYRLHRRRDAEESLRRALQLDPDDLYAQSVMATLLQDQRKDAQAEVLADLIRESPGTEEFVESIRQEAKKRRIAKMLVERRAMPEPPTGVTTRHIAAWLLTVSLMIVGMCLLVDPKDTRTVVLCIVLPLIGAWFLRRLFQ